MTKPSDARLENMMLGETVIYMDEHGTRHPAMILKVHSDRLVDLLLFSEAKMTDPMRRSVTYSSTDQANSWWRRIKF